MVTEVEIKRINELSKKSKTKEGLSSEEKAEQKVLRQKYLDGVRSSFTDQISTLKVVDPEGKDVTPDKVKELKSQKQSTKDDE